MVKLIFVRHGQTTWNAQDRLQGQLDPPLNDLGLRQAEAAAEALSTDRIDAVFSSDLQRAYVTAKTIAARHGLTVGADRLLREVCLGEWEGLTFQEAKARNPVEHEAYREDSIANRPPGAERLESVIDRARQFVEMVAAEYPMGNVIIVTHGGIIRGAICVALDAGPRLFRRVKLDNAGITTIGFSGSESHIFAVNETCHVRGLEVTKTVQEL